MRCGKKVCHRLNSFQKKSKNEQKHRMKKKKKQKMKEKKTLCKWTELHKFLDCLLTTLECQITYMNYFFFSYFARLNFSCTFFSVSICCLRFGCLSSMCMMVLWSFESFYILWMSRINEQNFLFAKFIKHRIHFSTIFYLFHFFLVRSVQITHTPMHMIIVFLASITRIYRLH